MYTTQNRGATFTSTTHFYVESCYSCSMLFAMPIEFKNKRRQDQKSFYCPQGHAQHYVGITDKQKLEKALEAEKRRTAYAVDRAETLRKQRDRAERSKSALKGVVTKAKKRSAAGVCQCCNRTFKQLARHMASQHPGYVKGVGK